MTPIKSKGTSNSKLVGLQTIKAKYNLI